MTGQIIPLLLAVALLSGCHASTGPYPSLLPRAGETPRAIPEAAEDAAVTLPTEERSEIERELADIRTAFDATRQKLRATRADLDKAMEAARHTASGSTPWSAAQMAIARYDIARGPLDSLSARLAFLARPVHDLPEEDSLRQAVMTLTNTIGHEAEDAEATSRKASATLSR